MASVVATPSAEHLSSQINPNPMLLQPSTAEMFHHNVAKLLFLCKCACPDIQTAMAFLSQWVQKPDIDDYKKLARVMKYLMVTITMPLVLKVYQSNHLYWWVDGMFANHEDMQSHAGDALTLIRTRCCIWNFLCHIN